MKKFTIIFTLLLVPAIAFPWAGGESIISILADMISSDLQISSLGVGVAATGVAGEARIKSIQPIDGTSPNIVKLPVGSSATSILKCNNEAGTTVVDIAPLGTTVTGYLTATQQITTTSNLRGAKIRPTGPNNDVIMQVYADTDGFALQNTAGADAFRFDLDGADRKLSFLGTTNTGVLTWDDSESLLNLDGAMSLDGSISTTHVALTPQSAAPTLPTTGSQIYNLAADGSTNIATVNGSVFSVDVDGNMSLDGSLETTHVYFPPQSSAPTTPTTGFIIYCEEATGDKITLWSSGNITRDVAQ